MKSTVSTLALAAIMMMAFSIGASATPINGSIWINSISDPTLDTTSLATATKTTSGALGIVTDSSTGDYLPFIDEFVDFYAFTWNPVTVPVQPLWSFSLGGGSFDLTSMTVDLQNAMFLNISGTGILYLNGFDPTPGTWAFSITDADGNTTPNLTFGFTSSNATVPEGNTSAVLIGMGLLGIFIGTRSLKTSLGSGN